MRGRAAARSRRRDPRGYAVELIERLGEWHRAPDEDRRLALGVRRRFGLAQVGHEGEEVAHVVALESDHELLVVDSEAVSSVDTDSRIAMPDGEVRRHDPRALLVRQHVPRPLLGHRVHDDVGLVALALARVAAPPFRRDGDGHIAKELVHPAASASASSAAVTTSSRMGSSCASETKKHSSAEGGRSTPRRNIAAWNRANAARSVASASSSLRTGWSVKKAVSREPTRCTLAAVGERRAARASPLARRPPSASRRSYAAASRRPSVARPAAIASGFPERVPA